ncbi:MAG TPA: hypothetical protein VIC58_03450 [Actinomycetota bacterium]
MTPRDKKLLQITGIALPLVLLAYFFVLRPSGGEEVALPEFPTGATGGPVATPSVTPSPTPRETLPPVDLAGARDPFSIPPGLELSGGGSVSPTTSPTSPTTAPPTTAPPTTPPPTNPPPTTPPPTNPPPTSPPPPPPEKPGNSILIGGHHVVLENVAGNGRSVEVEVDGRVYTVEPGAVFAGNFKLVRIDGRCARFLFGDQKFDLCEKH